ncbi:endoribonuclease Dicer isoform X4 [Aphis craccivora]|uniref:Endoribonuclease Dicer isoform X4 n=1 Tax=Aphis craccivora TaxID=307492 RepID=A0A6G0X9J5_APHCR|nr:endoribonuclease Dicer isoform X4 [Aphis craccivora]
MDRPLKGTSSEVPQGYQRELLEIIRTSNTIVFLPTESDKTYIATSLIKHLGDCLTKPKGRGRKWTFFIVQCESLTKQLAEDLRRHLPWNIGAFGDNMNIKHLSKENWEKILEKCHVSTNVP